jgi:hypothetical protein
MDLRSGRLAEGHHSAECGTFCARWLSACQDPAINGHDWTTGRAAGAEGREHLGHHTRLGGLTWLGAS